MRAPADKTQCQSEKPNPGYSPFRIGGGIHCRQKRIRCKNKPLIIVSEKTKSTDGLNGSMSLCNDCLTSFKNQFHANIWKDQKGKTENDYNYKLIKT